MVLPLDEIIVGIFALITAIVGGVFTVYNTKLNRKLNKVENKSEDNKLLTVQNNILEQLVPAFERKDEALDKIAEILENILRVQELQNTRICSIEMLVKNRCEAPELISVIEQLIEMEGRKGVNIDLLRSLIENYENPKDTP